jgi:23S rRNA (cytidine1920-2'-O)/16S rRNA (cytidine1409-2'-O)-methyltransferase
MVTPRRQTGRLIDLAKTERLDVLVVERGLFESREAARTAIMEGVVLIDGKQATKPGAAVSREARIELSPSYAPPKYVSRGGLKLEKALQVFKVRPEARVCLDVGASTGGFTDCLLQQGAQHVFAIDVGYGQLDWSLRNNRRVTCLERTNCRHLTQQGLYGTGSVTASLAVIDVSFISLTKIMPAVNLLLADDSDVIALIKPQFEAGRTQVGKGGVVRSPQVHLSIACQVFQSVEKLGLRLQALTYSPIKGPKGNIEFLAHFRKVNAASDEPADLNVDVEAVVEAAHADLS